MMRGAIEKTCYACVLSYCLAAASGTAHCAPGNAARGAGWDDAWLAEAVLVELDRAAEAGRFEPLAERIESAILARLACGDIGRLRALNDMVYAMRACRALTPTRGAEPGKKPDKKPGKELDKSFTKWLLAHPRISRPLFRAVADGDAAEAMAGLRRLVSAEEKAVLAYGELAVAFATARPARHPRPGPDQASMLDSFRWYTDPKRNFRHNLKKLPHEMLRYLADTRLSLAERRWAMEQYGRAKRPARAYFNVRYDFDHFKKGKPKRVSSLPYTLANLRRVGGVCVDQAYYASEVCKALGIPATIVFGRGGAGVPHSWFAHVRSGRTGRPSWNCRTGRYAGNKYFIGWVHDPGGGPDRPDSVLALQGRIAQLSPRLREQADTAVVLARLVHRAFTRARKPDLAALTAMAKVYDASSADGRRPADTHWVKLRRPIDLQLARDLIGEALARDLVHPPAWEFVVELRKADQLSVRRFGSLFNSLFTRTGKGYPDFGYILITRVMSTMRRFADRRKIYDRAIGLYKKRPDLQGRILIALGDDYRRQGKLDDALARYRRAARHCVGLADIVIKAARRAEELLIKRGRRDEAISMYRKLWAGTEKEDVSEVYLAQTSHYQLGVRLAVLLDAAGKKTAAQTVRRAITN